MKPRLYLETTVPSYLTSRPSRDLIVAGHQQITREWREKRTGAFQIYISQLVIDEASAGDPAAAHEWLKAIQDLPLLDITPDAIAAVHGMSFLVTWNCVHIANAAIAKALAWICREHGFECPVICTPEELMGE
ncbi:MAG: type II toxin-antitoxin system VapC family toxin [Bryobacteraceae bacterium]|jgi:hypothetical protein